MQFNLYSFFKLFFTFLLLGCTVGYAQTLRGKVTDAGTGEPMIGATVTILRPMRQTSVRLDGSYIFKDVKAGTYTLQVKYISYKATQQTVVVGATLTHANFVLYPQTNELITVDVKASAESTEGRARSIEKSANQLVNVFSQKTIELLPDITVANIMQRVPGIVIDRSNSGEGRYPVIRGMDKRYNTTLVNGIKIPSPDNNNRYVPLDLFPSELLERLEVSKSLTPSMEGDAIGGTINMVMKDAPQTLLIQANASAGYSTILSDQPFLAFDHSVINKKSPAEINGSNYAASPKEFPAGNLSYTKLNNPVNKTFGLTLGDRFGAKKQFGAVVSASYQDIYRGSNSTYFFPNTQPGAGNAPIFADLYLRQYSTQNKRLGLYSNLDYVISPKNKITLYNMYIRTDDFQTRNTIDSVRTISYTGPGNGLVSNESRSTWQIQQIFNSTLKGTHRLSNVLAADWSAVFSAAKNEIPDYASFSTQHGVSTSSSGVVTDGVPYLSTMTRRWSHNTDKDASLYANLTFTPKVAGRKSEFKTGGLYRHKDRSNYFNQYDLVPVVPAGSNNQAYSDIFSAQFGYKGSDGGKSGEINANTYTVQENISAGYLQEKLAVTDNLEALGGLRVEHTYNHYETVQPFSIAGRSGTIYYTDLLPSLQFKYSLTAKQALRLAYYKAISRPGYFELVPTLINGETYNEAGNYNLNRSSAQNLDLRYEFFPGAADQLLIGTFYKYITDPIEYGLVPVSGTNTSQVLQPRNYGSATNYGAEIAATKYIGSFGVSANYTYTHSRITTTKTYIPRNANGSAGAPVDMDQTRPLQGQADHIGNVSFIYKNPKLGLDAQIAYVYTGKRIIVVSPYYGLDYWQRPFSQLDLSVEKKLMKRFSVYTKMTNLTNSTTKVDVLQPNTFLSGRDLLPMQESADKILVQNTYYKPSFLLGLRYKFN